MLEKSVEGYLREQVEKRGGVCVKLDPAGNKGLPDRLVLLPYGVSFLVEVKKPKGGVVSEHQYKWLRRLGKMEHLACVVLTYEGVDMLLQQFDEFPLETMEVMGSA